MVGRICKSYGWSKKGMDDLVTVGMICKRYGWSAQQYKRPVNGRTDL